MAFKLSHKFVKLLYLPPLICLPCFRFEKENCFVFDNYFFLEVVVDNLLYTLFYRQLYTISN